MLACVNSVSLVHSIGKKGDDKRDKLCRTCCCQPSFPSFLLSIADKVPQHPVLSPVPLILTSELFSLSGAAFGLEPPPSPVALELRGQSLIELSILSSLRAIWNEPLSG